MKVSLPWWRILTEAVGKETLERARGVSLPAIARTGGESPARFTSVARYLKVQMLDAKTSEELLSLSMPATEIVRLEEIVPAEARTRLAATGKELAKLVAVICSTSIAPQEVLRWQEDGRAIRVWLE